MALRFWEGGLACKLDGNPFLGLPLGPQGSRGKTGRSGHAAPASSSCPGGA